jgi:hypothetical protein
MLSGPKGTEHDLIATCSVCGYVEELFELPGRTEKCCLECSADLATAILLSTEIDAATLVGRNSNALVTEFTEVSGRMLERSQSASFLMAERQRARCPRKYSAWFKELTLRLSRAGARS